jgi:hypothetical protein
MRKIILVASLLSAAFIGTVANAKQEIDVKRTIWELSDFPKLAEQAKAVCASKAVLSDKLKKACAVEQFPSVTKAGLFRNTGIGAELNAMIRQQ